MQNYYRKIIDLTAKNLSLKSASLTAPVAVGRIPLRRDHLSAKVYFEPPA